MCRRCVHLKTFGVGAAKTVAKTIKERQGIVYASGITEHGEARNGVEQELQLPGFIAEYEKYFLGGRMYVEVYSRREGGRLLSAGSTGRIAVLQMIDEDGRSAIFVPPGGPAGTGSAEVVCVPIHEGVRRIRLMFRHGRGNGVAEPAPHDQGRQLPHPGLLVLSVERGWGAAHSQGADFLSTLEQSTIAVTDEIHERRRSRTYILSY